MNKIQYNDQYDHEIKEVRRLYQKKFGIVINTATRYKHLRDYIMKCTEFLDNQKFHFSFSSRLWYTENKLDHVHKCPVCGKEVYRNIDQIANPETRTVERLCCSHKCSVNAEAFKDACKKTNLKRYGVEWVTKTEWHKKAAVDGCMKRYGVPYYTQTEDGKKIVREYIKKHPEFARRNRILRQKALGNMSEEQIKDMKEKSRLGRRKRYYEKLYCNNEEVIMLTPFEEYVKINTKHGIFKWKCLKCGAEFESGIDFNWALAKAFKDDNIYHSYARCEHCHPKEKQISKQEISFVEYLKELCSKYGYTVCHDQEINRNLIPPYEIDVYIPELKFGFEYNGIWWHCEEHYKLQNNGHGTTKLGIYGKSEECDKIGLSLFHIYETEWMDYRSKTKEYLEKIISGKMRFNINEFPYDIDRDKFPVNFITKYFDIIGKSGPIVKIIKDKSGGKFTIGTSGTIKITLKDIVNNIN